MINSIEVKITDNSRHKQTIVEYEDNLEGEGKRKFLEDFGNIMVAAIARYAPRAGIGAQGGKLATTAFYETDDDSVTLYLQNYWPFVEFDTKPHIILPKKPGGVLAFPRPGLPISAKIDVANKDMIFTKKVKHPGTKGQFFIAKSWNRSRALVEKLLDQYARGEL